MRKLTTLKLRVAVIAEMLFREGAVFLTRKAREIRENTLPKLEDDLERGT